MDCKSCRERYISQLAHEADMARMERTNQRFFWALIIAIVAVAVSNLLWFRGWMAYDYVSTTYTVDAGEGGSARYIGDNANYYEGDYYGEGDRQKEEQDP